MMKQFHIYHRRTIYMYICIKYKKKNKSKIKSHYNLLTRVACQERTIKNLKLSVHQIFIRETTKESSTRYQN